jgi:HAD superfamily hydrolase (TIGR01509 family)
MAVASGGIRRIIDAQLAQIKLSHLFTVRVTAEGTERHKPEPDVFLEAARQLDVDPRRCLVFEDSPFGFEAAIKDSMGWVDVRVPSNEFVIETSGY